MIARYTEAAQKASFIRDGKHTKQVSNIQIIENRQQF